MTSLQSINWGTEMGQAKLRAQEIKDLKASEVIINFLATRHMKNGGREFVAATVEIPAKPVNSKERLLAAITLNKWNHTAPVDRIAEYLLQTNAYATGKQAGMYEEGVYLMVDFYEADPSHPQKVPSCRNITIMQTKQRWIDVQEAIKAELAGDSMMDVRINH